MALCHGSPSGLAQTPRRRHEDRWSLLGARSQRSPCPQLPSLGASSPHPPRGRRHPPGHSRDRARAGCPSALRPSSSPTAAPRDTRNADRGPGSQAQDQPEKPTLAVAGGTEHLETHKGRGPRQETAQAQTGPQRRTPSDPRSMTNAQPPRCERVCRRHTDTTPPDGPGGAAASVP